MRNATRENNSANQRGIAVFCEITLKAIILLPPLSFHGRILQWLMEIIIHAISKYNNIFRLRYNLFFIKNFWKFVISFRLVDLEYKGNFPPRRHFVGISARIIIDARIMESTNSGYSLRLWSATPVVLLA